MIIRVDVPTSMVTVDGVARQVTLPESAARIDWMEWHDDHLIVQAQPGYVEPDRSEYLALWRNVVSARELVLAFDQEQRKAFLDDPEMRARIEQAKATEWVHLDHPDFQATVAYAVANNVLGPDTAAQINAALAPLIGGE